MDSSISEEEEEDKKHFSAFSKFDESIEVRNAEEIKSPVSGKAKLVRKNSKGVSNSFETDEMEIQSSNDKRSFRRFSNHETSFEKPVRPMESDPSDSDETDDDDIEGTNVKKPIELYNPKEFENLEASAEVKELFQNIMRYTPQKIELNYKLAPYIMEFIPAVGDIDAFIKVPRPDGVADKVGLTVLDEPCANQSEPAVLHLQLRSQSKSADSRKATVIKRVEDPEKYPKSIERWIEDMGLLHRSKHLPAVRLTSPMPDIDALIQQWPPDIEDKLSEAQLDFSTLDCELPQLVDIVCNLLDIPVKPEIRLESLHTLFTLFLEVREFNKDRGGF
ncbi:GSCOCG00013278001-RA-CDS [Cotesia congregata]|uniref:Intraflagellar transport protein 46 homolog n=1 Tax=Cotesia congregata TaxID=51543 RepID=A0A8J2MJ34_COTCN|nr:GSCOCG00013278001-RA-CDS [Cotesia congregata]CAG5094036.1 Similar to SJCHGC08984: Intraflagellar transport protein 46 homolog (Schistosoma japonicum) [Cotesia congregata]